MAEHRSEFVKFFNELKRRKIVRVIIIYATTAFILLQVVGLVVDPLKLPEWVMSLVIVLLIIGFPLVIIFAWAYHMTPKDGTQPNLIHDSNKQDKLSFEHPLPHDKSIVVLPFENMSSDPEQEYFSDGLTEEIITDLSYIHDLLVISRSSAMTFKGSKQTIKKIANKVNVRYVLEGSVRKSGNNLRITAQLIDAKDDTHIWAEKYNGTLDDIFDIQEKVSRSIADELKIKLSPKESQKIKKCDIDNTQAYDCYLKSRQDLWKSSEKSLLRAEQNLKNGLELLGENELLYAGLGQVYFQFYDTGIKPEEIYLDKVKDYTNKIFEIQPKSSHGYRLRGLLKLKRENSHLAYVDFIKSYELDTSDPETIMWLIYIPCIHLGHPEKAEFFVKKILEIDPLMPITQGLPAQYHWVKGSFDLALVYFHKWTEMEPDSHLARWYLGTFMLFTNDYENAFKLIDQAVQNSPENLFTKLLLLLKYSVQKSKNEVLKLLTEDVRGFAWEDFHLPWYIADCYALIEEKEQSLIWLERAVEKGFINYPLFSDMDPFLESIREEPRFKKLMIKVKHEWENFEV